MARVMKVFETEDDFEDWVNSPNVRTPYTCKVRQTGAVHYFDGDNDDYSVTFIMRDDIQPMSVPVVGTNMAPCVVNGKRVAYSSRNKRGRGHGDRGTRIFINDVEVPISQLYAGLSNHNTYYRKRNVRINPSDVVKVVFNTPYIDSGGFFRTMGYWVKEVIIGDGIQEIGRRAFSYCNGAWRDGDDYNKTDTIKVDIGKNVYYLEEACFRHCNVRIQFNLCMKEVLQSETFYEDDSIYECLTDSSKNLYEEV